MGNDGGSIPTRRELVKEAARNPNLTDLKEKQKEHLAHRWSQCPISHKALTKPIVADYTGDLYNKDAIIQFLLPDEVSAIDKAEADTFIQGRVKALKDVVEVQFETEHDEKSNTERRVCPVTGKELGPGTKAVFLVPCGHAFSSEAIKEVKSNECVQCGQSYESPRDVVPILPTTEVDKKFVVERLETLRSLGLSHTLKKASGNKKRKAKEAAVEDTNEAMTRKDEKTAGTAGSTTIDNGISIARPLSKEKTANIKNAATASLNVRVLEELEAKKKRRIESENDTIQSLYSKSKGTNKEQRDGNFFTRGFSIPADAQHR